MVVIDDCSSDATATIARAAGATVLPLTLQLGAWGAIQTGLRYALRHGYRTAITLDADGQHEPECISELVEPLADRRADVVIGAFPERASRARRIAWSYFRWLTGLKLEDITSGFRAYNHTAMTVLAAPEASLLDYQDVGVLLILRRKGLRTVEVPVSKMCIRDRKQPVGIVTFGETDGRGDFAHQLILLHQPDVYKRQRWDSSSSKPSSR